MDEELLSDIGEAVVSVDERLAGVEEALRASMGVGQGVGDGRRALRGRRYEPGPTSSAALRRMRQRRSDAAGITWTVWELDHLTEAERLTALHEIRGFADWLNRAYALTVSTYAVPSCWYEHPGAVRELWALLASYHHTYTTRVRKEAAQPTDAPIFWHERVLWPCLRRLREEHGLRECVATNRHTHEVQTPIATDVDGFGGAVKRLAARWNT